MERFDIEIRRGADWQMSLSYTDDNGVPMDLSGCRVYCQIRQFAEAESYEECSVSTFDSEGRILLSLTHTQTARLMYNRGVYDVIVHEVESGRVDLLVSGDAVIYADVTRGAILEGAERAQVWIYESLADFPDVGNALNLYLSRENLKFYFWDGEYIPLTMATAEMIGAVPTTGGTMSGELYLYGDPQTANGAASKSYVDNAVAQAVSGVSSFAEALNSAGVKSLVETMYYL